MLPGPPASIDQQYKQDTNAAATWHAATERAYGYPADLLSPEPLESQDSEHKSRSKRLKGKARKLAKLNTEPVP